MQKININEIVYFTVDQKDREVVLFGDKGKILYECKYASTSPIGQAIRLLLRLVILAYKYA